MLSRVADSLYWMSRYMERTDSILRMLKINHLSSQDDGDEFTWQPVLRIFSNMEESQIKSIERNGKQVLQYMMVDRENPNSVFNMVTQARENGRSVQDNITKELWQSLNELYHVVSHDKLQYSLQREDTVTVLDSLIKQCMVYYGIADITMFRGEGLSFMNIGKFLERSIQTTDILNVKFSNLLFDMDKTADTTYWKHLLLSVSGYELYLKRYRSAFEARNIIDQILFNVDFPRSVIYSINHLHRYITRIRGEQNTEGNTKLDFQVGRLKSKLQYSNVQSVSQIGLHHFLSEIRTDIFAVGGTLNQHYFAYS